MKFNRGGSEVDKGRCLAVWLAATVYITVLVRPPDFARSVYPPRHDTQGSSKTCAVSLLASDPCHNASLASAAAAAAGLADETLL